jgi:hypothetical protein
MSRSHDLYGPALVCPQANPEFRQLLSWAGQIEARSIVVVFKMWARILVAFAEREDEEGNNELEMWQAFAAVDEKKRRDAAEYDRGLHPFLASSAHSSSVLMDAFVRPGFSAMFESAWREGYARVLAALHQRARDIPEEVTVDGTTSTTASSGFQYFKRDPPESVLRSLLTYESFLVWLGRVGINREDDGGARSTKG